jgi:hypothetical protein
MLGRLHVALTLALAFALLACSGGRQALYIATDRPGDFTVTIDGKKRELPLHGFQGYFDLDLTKGAVVIVEGPGLNEKRKLSPVEKDKNALYLLEGAPTLQLVDYKKLTSVGTGNNPGSGGHQLGPLTRGEIDIVQIDRISSKMAAFPKESVIVGPDAPMPKGGSVNQVTYEKFPIYRLERVSPDTVDPFDEIGPRVTKELGWDVLPGGQPAAGY